MIRPATHLLQKLIEASKTHILRTSSQVLSGTDTYYYGVVTVEVNYWEAHNDVKKIELNLIDYEVRLLIEELTNHIKKIDKALGKDES